MVDYMMPGMVFALALSGLASLMIGAESNAASDAGFVTGAYTWAWTIISTVMCLAAAGYF